MGAEARADAGRMTMPFAHETWFDDQVGLRMGDLEFARTAGAIEVLFGLLLISGALPQAIILIAGIPFNATLSDAPPVRSTRARRPR
jgi:hypothetical protein